MADDGLLLNFAVANTPAIPIASSQYKGRWKERAASKRWDKIKVRRALTGSAVPAAKSAKSVPVTAPEVTSENGTNRQLNPQASSPRPLKRKRGMDVASAANATPVGPRKSTSSSLFTNLPEITREEKPVTTSQPSDPAIEVIASTTSTSAIQETTSAEPSDFPSLGVTRTIVTHLQKSLSISTPTQIQNLAIPHLLSSTRDTFLRAQTGSGKTLAYLLPILQTLYSLSTPTHKFDRTSGCFALILVPTRELAKQIETVLTILTAGTWLVPGWLLGGERKKSEKARLRKGVNILVGTPGRVLDHLETTMAFDTSFVRWIVLDEGDRLVDMGFLESVGKILRIVEGRAENRIRREQIGINKLPGRIVKVLCSATLKGEEGLGALETIVEPVFLKAETETQESSEDVDHVFTPGELSQKAVVLPAKLRLVTLTALLTSFAKRPPPAKMIVFFSCTSTIDFHFQLLSSYNLDLHLFQIHGSLDQPVRTATMKAFTSTKQRAVLLATDVASRGLDLPFVDMIIQYDPPISRDDYIHRVGRTARAGRPGEGILFLLPSEEEYITSLTSHGAQINRVSYDTILKSAFGKEWMNISTTNQLHAEKWVLSDSEKTTLARSAFQGHIRAYTTHLSSEREMFNVRRIHLGHLAKSFALREAPAEAMAAARRQRIKDEERRARKGLKVDGIRGEEGGREKLVKKARYLERKGAMDEFS